jgi:GNAT superfamily N-acetyltransferase
VSQLNLADPPFAQLENAEADSWAEIQASVSTNFRDRFGVSVDRVAGAVVITASLTDMPALNRTWLPGQMTAATSDSIAAVLQHARSKGVARLLIHCPTWATPEGFRIVGARVVSPMIKLYQRVNATAFSASPFRIQVVGTADRQRFGEVAARGNDAPPFMADGFNSTIGQAGWRHYLAFEGDVPVAAAAVRFHRDVAWCCFAGTLPAYRGRGAQRALLARRVSDAAAHGCQWVTCESLPDRPGIRSVSLANMLATGFSRAYERPSFIVELSKPIA